MKPLLHFLLLLLFTVPVEAQDTRASSYIDHSLKVELARRLGCISKDYEDAVKRHAEAVLEEAVKRDVRTMLKP